MDRASPRGLRHHIGCGTGERGLSGDLQYWARSRQLFSGIRRDRGGERGRRSGRPILSRKKGRNS